MLNYSDLWIKSSLWECFKKKAMKNLVNCYECYSLCIPALWLAYSRHYWNNTYISPVTCLTSLPWLVLYVILWPGTSTAPGTQLTLSILWVTTGNWTLTGCGRGTVDRRQMTINILSVPLKSYCARDVDNRRKRKWYGKKIFKKWKEATMA